LVQQAITGKIKEKEQMLKLLDGVDELVSKILNDEHEFVNFFQLDI